MSEYRIDLYRGDNRTIEVTVIDSDGVAVVLTSATITFTVKASYNSAALITKSSATPTQISITDAAHGKYEIYLVPTDTDLLNIATYVFDSQVVLSSGKKYTVVSGTLELKPDVTR